MPERNGRNHLEQCSESFEGMDSFRSGVPSGLKMLVNQYLEFLPNFIPVVYEIRTISFFSGSF